MLVRRLYDARVRRAPAGNESGEQISTPSPSVGHGGSTPRRYQVVLLVPKGEGRGRDVNRLESTDDDYQSAGAGLAAEAAECRPGQNLEFWAATIWGGAVSRNTRVHVGAAGRGLVDGHELLPVHREDRSS
jgi:hypothetical protein